MTWTEILKFIRNVSDDGQVLTVLFLTRKVINFSGISSCLPSFIQGQIQRSNFPPHFHTKILHRKVWILTWNEGSESRHCWSVCLMVCVVGCNPLCNWFLPGACPSLWERDKGHPWKWQAVGSGSAYKYKYKNMFGPNGSVVQLCEGQVFIFSAWIRMASLRYQRQLPCLMHMRSE